MTADTFPLHMSIVNLARACARWGRGPIWVAALLMALTAPVSGATKREQAKAAVEKAETAYKLGRFDEALADYARAYELVSAPALLFNLGQCHKQLKEYERAIFFFEGYLRDESRPTNRRLARELIVESRAALAKSEAARAAPKSESVGSAPAVPTVPVGPSGAAPVSPEPPHAAPTAVSGEAVLISAPLAAPAPAARPATRRWWLWTTIAVAVLGAGAFAYYETGSKTMVAPEGTIGTIDRR